MSPNPHEVNMLLAMLILGFPVAFVFGGPLLWRGFAIVAFLLLLGLYPTAGLGVGLLILLWRPLCWFAAAILGGFGAGLGLRASGFARNLSMPRRPRLLMPRAPRVQRYRAPPRGYEPNDSFNDDFPDNLPEGRE